MVELRARGRAASFPVMSETLGAVLGGFEDMGLR